MVLIHLRRVNATRTVNTTCVAGKTLRLHSFLVSHCSIGRGEHCRAFKQAREER